MKIGVVTYWSGNSNYGMMLQCWALQHYLKENGHNPFVIRFVPKGSILRKSAKKIIERVMCILSKERREKYCKQQYLKKISEEKDKQRQFQYFRNQYLEMSDQIYYHLSDLQRDPPKANCYIAGSDQIWCSVAKSDDSLGYFLCFGEKSVKRIAYAPSIGKPTYPKRMMDLFVSVLHNFDFLSCREYDAVNLCRQVGFNATKVEDPTLLLKNSDYEGICEDIRYRDYLFIYSVNIRRQEDIYWDYIKNIFANRNIIVTPANGNSVSSEIFGDDVQYNYATPGEWLSLIKNSDFVITSSFHGVAFSIIFNKRFAYVPVKGAYASGNNRITDLLKGVGLESVIVNNPEDYKRIFDKDIVWDAVNQRKENLIKNSISYLQNALK